MSQTHSIIIDQDGNIQFIYSDELAPLLSEGEATITRASHVEPAADSSGWEADMAPSNGPVLGPFPTRGEALQAEVDWLERNVFELETST